MLIETIAITFLVLLLAVGGMAVGVIVSGRRITGSCGGLSAVQGVDRCGVCGRDLQDPDERDCERQGTGTRGMSA
ncbi:MAG: (Na+)-NQR maturation NqrM [Kiloniellales bacterium]|nr:(Na+)-NQR maturation NqrM [Kiloniellales bacterium]